MEKRAMSEPTSLQEAVLYFSDPANCREYMVARRWPNGVECPRCGSKNVLFLEKYNRWECREKHDARQFTLKTGTVFEESPISLDKWITAMWMLVNCKNGVSSWEIHRTIKVTQKSAWFMLGRLRLALQDKRSGGKLGGSNGSPVEIDETFIGGKARNMHRAKRERLSADRGMQGGSGKAVVMGMLERGGKVRATVLGHRRDKKQMHQIIAENVEVGTPVMTDEFGNYDGLSPKYAHEVVNHLEKYVEGNVHTQGIENFWSCLKRGLGGTYIAVEPFHLFRYVDEQAFRFNNRATKDNPLNDADRFDLAMRQVVGKRLTYDELTGKSPAQTAGEIRF
jgi:transposase-like protein